MKRLTKRDGKYMDCLCENCEAKNQDFCDCGFEVWARLKQYEDMEEQGLLVRLPCKVGDTVYRVIRGKKGRGHIAPATVSGLHLGDTTRNRRYQKEYEYLVLRVDGGFCAHVNKKDIGKTVFLTQKAAEKALEDA